MLDDISKEIIVQQQAKNDHCFYLHRQFTIKESVYLYLLNKKIC